jgi:ribose 5-phosphate isomerase B
MRDVQESEVRRLVRDALERVLGPEPKQGGASAAGAKPAPPVSESGGGPQARTHPRPAPPTTGNDSRRVAIGADHGGFDLKQVLKRAIVEDLGWEVVDCGTHSSAPVDYPDFAAAVAREVARGSCAWGIVVDAAGIGSTMAANKVAGVRCALCHDDVTVRNSREHNDANMLAIGARVVNRGQATRMVRLFLTTPFGGGRHERRVRKIMALESSG